MKLPKMSYEVQKYAFLNDIKPSIFVVLAPLNPRPTRYYFDRKATKALEHPFPIIMKIEILK
jgi:hypothetical protein